MPIAQSKLTAQGQISVPAQVRQKLAVGPGSVLEWTEIGEEIVVRRAGKHNCEAVHTALFGQAKPMASPAMSTPEGIREHMRRKHARR